MFQPSQEDVRRFFCAAAAKQLAAGVMTPMEALAARWIEQHPEYAADLADEAEALARVYVVEDGRKGREVFEPEASAARRAASWIIARLPHDWF